MIELRDYQRSVVAAVREAFGRQRKHAPLIVMPTGSGKTATFAVMCHGAAAKGNRVLILSHRIELIDQISAALNATDTPHGFIAAGYGRVSAPTQVASVATLIRRLDKVDEPQLIIVDEAHHSRSATFSTILAKWPQARIIGFTATPIRLSGEGLAEIFDHLIVGPSMRELIDRGYLANYRLFSPPIVDVSGLHRRMGDFVASEAEALMDKPAITGTALQHYRQHADGLPALVFCVSIRHATEVAAQFRGAGYSAVMLEGNTDRAIRRGVINDFRAGRLQAITSVDVLGEGLDVPGAHCGIFLRPTQSLGLFLQQVGRILRPCEGKSHAILLDAVGNCQRLGLPDEPRDWQLTYDEEHRKRQSAVSVRVCQRCFCALPSGTPRCPECGFEFPLKPRQVEQRDGELIELTAEQIAERAERRRLGFQRSQADTLEKMIAYGRAKGVKGDVNRWAQHVLASRAAKRARQ